MATSNYTGNSIVDYLGSTGAASDFNSRSQLAAQNGITNYTGTADQNLSLLGKLRGGATGTSQSAPNIPQTIQSPQIPSSNSNAVNNTPVNNVPQAQNLQSLNSINVPPYQSPSSSGNAKAVITNVGAMNQNAGNALSPSQQALLNTTDPAASQAQANYDQQKGQTQNLINQYMGMGQDQLNQEAAAGVPQLQTQSNQLTQQYLAAQATYNSEYNSIINDPTLTREQSAQKIDDLQQQHGYNLTNIGIQQSIAQNDYNNAESLIQHQIQIKYGSLKDTIGFQQNFLAQAQDQLTQKQQQSFQANLAVQQQMYTQGTFYSQLNATTGMDILKQATTNGAPQDVINNLGQLIANGGTPAQIAAAAGKYAATGSYTLAYNANTQQMEPYNQNTGLFKDGSAVSATAQTINQTDPNSAGVVTAPDGSQYDLSSYATDPTYTTALQGATSTIQSMVGTVNSPQSMQSVISTMAPTSPITGTMAYSAAKNAGIDPTVFAAQLQKESIFGTSNVAAANNNFGGVTYTGSQAQLSAGITQGSPRPKTEGGYYAKFPTAQAGLNYQAGIVAKMKVPPPPTTPGQTLDTQAGIKGVQQIKASLPVNIGTAVNWINATGNGYIDMSKVKDIPGSPSGSAQTQAYAYAKEYGLAALNSDQVSAVQDYDAAMQRVNNIQQSWNAVAPQSVPSAVLNGLTNGISEAFKTGKGTDLIKYKSNVGNAIAAFNETTGSKRLTPFSATLAESSLPVVPDVHTGVNADTLASGNAKLDNTRQTLNATLMAIDPAHFTPAPLSKELQTNQQQNIITAPDGTQVIITD